MTQNTNEPLHIVGTDLLDYSFKVEKAVKEGWTFSDKNEYAPRAWPHMFEAWMLQANSKIADNLTVKVELDATEVKQTIKDGIEKVEKLSESIYVESKDTPKLVDTKDENKTLVEDSKPVTKRGRK